MIAIKPNIKFIRELLSERNWSERKLAYKTGLSQATVSRILSGKRGAEMKTLNGLRKVFPDISLEMLFILESDATERDGTAGGWYE